MAEQNTIFGKGFIFPIELLNGRPIIVTDEELIKSNIKGVLAFEYGTRFFQPEIGSRLKKLLAEPADAVLKRTMLFFIKETIDRWEPRVLINSTKSYVSIDRAKGKVDVFLSLENRKTGQDISFIIPFYKNTI